MAFQVRIQNLGKLADATVRVGGLTVLAGVNDTGKSFFSKALYSVFDAMNANHALTEIQARTEALQSGLSELELWDFEKIPPLESMETNLKRLEDMCVPLSGKGDEIAAVEAKHADLSKVAKEVIHAYGELRPALEQQAAEADPFQFNDDSIKQMDASIEDVKNLLGLKPKDIVLQGFARALQVNLLGNFQVSALANLKGNSEQDASIVIEGIGDISIASGRLKGNIRPKGLMRLQEHSRVIYLESPVHWKLRSALRGRMSRFALLRGLAVPKYFTDLNEGLNDEYSGDVAFPKLFGRLTGKDVMNGKILLPESGEMVFSRPGQSRPFPLPMTATGIVNLGVLAMLIERKILDKGTFLFIDEPESNLHPEWQVAMTEALYELAQGGVNVVVATHSVDILKRLEIYAKEKTKTANQIIAVNHFQRDGTVRSGGTEMIRSVKRDLSSPFFELYKRGLR